MHIEKINEPFLFRDGSSSAKYGAGLKPAIDRGWLTLHPAPSSPSRRPAPKCSLDDGDGSKFPLIYDEGATG